MLRGCGGADRNMTSDGQPHRVARAEGALPWGSGGHIAQADRTYARRWAYA